MVRDRLNSALRFFASPLSLSVSALNTRRSVTLHSKALCCRVGLSLFSGRLHFLTKERDVLLPLFGRDLGGTCVFPCVSAHCVLSVQVSAVSMKVFVDVGVTTRLSSALTREKLHDAFHRHSWLASFPDLECLPLLFGAKCCCSCFTRIWH